MTSTTAGQLVAKASADFALQVFESQGLGQEVVAVLDQTGRHEQRACPLKARLVMAFIVVMNLRRSLSLLTLLDELLDLLRQRVSGIPLRAVTSEAMCHARRRLGVDPMRLLFERLSARIRPEPSLGGLCAWVLDGVCLKVPDTAANEDAFGRPGTSRGRAGFPQLLAVALMDAESRQIRDVVFGRRTASERVGCLRLIEHLNSKDIVLQDQGLAAAWLFEILLNRGVHFLSRMPLYWRPRVRRYLPDGSALVRLSIKHAIPKEERPAHGGRASRRTELDLRMVDYRVGRFERVRLITDLLDSVSLPARELAVAYHVRWDVEIAFDEIKTHLAAVSHGIMRTTLRSKTPEGALQEAHGLLIAYNLIREMMLTAGRSHSIPPLELRHALISQLLADIAACRLSRPRRP